MNLGDLIKVLERMDSDERPPWGFNNPHSYRGYYEDLAFEPAVDVSYGEMLEAARSALGRTFEGYKGGDYTMDEHTTVWLARWGETGSVLGFGFTAGDDRW